MAKGPKEKSLESSSQKVLGLQMSSNHTVHDSSFRLCVYRGEAEGNQGLLSNLLSLLPSLSPSGRGRASWGHKALPVTAALCQEVWGGPCPWDSPLILVRGALLLLACTGSRVCWTDALASWEAPQQQQRLNKRMERETFTVENAGACSPSALPEEQGGQRSDEGCEQPFLSSHSPHGIGNRALVDPVGRYCQLGDLF